MYYCTFISGQSRTKKACEEHNKKPSPVVVVQRNRHAVYPPLERAEATYIHTRTRDTKEHHSCSYILYYYAYTLRIIYYIRGGRTLTYLCVSTSIYICMQIHFIRQKNLWHRQAHTFACIYNICVAFFVRSACVFSGTSASVWLCCHHCAYNRMRESQSVWKKNCHYI